MDLTVAANNVNSPPNVRIYSCKKIGNVLLQNVSTFSASDLNLIQESLIIEGNSQLPLIYLNSLKLYAVQGSVVVANNADLSNISFPTLTSAGNLSITSNPKVMAIDQFDMLATVEGQITVSGNFGNVSFPDLKNARSLSVSSANSTFNCSDFAMLWTYGFVKDAYECQGAYFDRSSSPVKASTPNQDDSTGGLATDEKAGIGLSALERSLFGLELF
ncbi:uncharacterized protein BDZ99DRAFT_515332 [Mytilinidion resinicola]|uniref:Receptor L-domain domain-containing protein n=1 Tax=Mytilinidion resinicola TaxID=574789 RepID=A0A6A6Z2Q1_9PEZI|nr:uncharacterized protein BDZ99DRAFT_515332 [Mytilinidion resinicola]KAF2814544.1 hypothetical protein BDZ99DRAFT_515332 [Mytilinidion resinicola]